MVKHIAKLEKFCEYQLGMTGEARDAVAGIVNEAGRVGLNYAVVKYLHGKDQKYVQQVYDWFKGAFNLFDVTQSLRGEAEASVGLECIERWAANNEITLA